MEEQGKGVRVSNCPFGWDVCYPFCYWRRGDKCYYSSKRGSQKRIRINPPSYSFWAKILKRCGYRVRGGERNETGKGDKRSIKEAKGRALEKGATARQLLSPHVGSHD